MKTEYNRTKYKPCQISRLNELGLVAKGVRAMSEAVAHELYCTGYGFANVASN